MPELKICPICGKGFMTVRNTYCSITCSSKARKRAIKENNKKYYKEHRDFILERVKSKLKNEKNEN